MISWASWSFPYRNDTGALLFRMRRARSQGESVTVGQNGGIITEVDCFVSEIFSSHGKRTRFRFRGNSGRWVGALAKSHRRTRGSSPEAAKQLNPTPARRG